ncbi:bifunctional DNA primase/polymerase [Streptomyces sp. NPDC002076]
MNHPTPDLRPSLLASALRYAERGMYVHPLLVGQKEPRWRDWEARATLDPELISRTWSRAPFNIGIACGPSRLVVVDLDVPHDGDAPPADFPDVVDGRSMLDAIATRTPGASLVPTMTVGTPSGGRHLVHRAPAGTEIRNSARTVAWCVDVRAAGGYVVGIGSVVDGRRYELQGSITEPVELPGWLLTLVTTSPKPPKAGGRGSVAALDARLRELSRGGTREERWAVGILRSEARELAGMTEGGRNDRLNLAAYRAGQLVAAGLLDQAVAEEELTAAARQAGLGDGYAQEIEKTIASGMTAGLRRPRHMGDAAVRQVGGAA